MGSIIAAAQQLAQRIDAVEGIRATHDPDRAAKLRPCVLVGPPSIDYASKANVWPLVCLSSKPHGSLQALAELDQLVQALSAVDGVYPEDATPAVYTLAVEPRELTAIPAYIVTITT